MISSLARLFYASYSPPLFKSIHSLFRIRVQKFRYIHDTAVRRGSTATLSSSRDHDVRSQTHTIMGIHRLVDFLESFDFRVDRVGARRHSLKTEMSAQI